MSLIRARRESYRASRFCVFSLVVGGVVVVSASLGFGLRVGDFPLRLAVCRGLVALCDCLGFPYGRPFWLNGLGKVDRKYETSMSESRRAQADSSSHCGKRTAGIVRSYDYGIRIMWRCVTGRYRCVTKLGVGETGKTDRTHGTEHKGIHDGHYNGHS